MSYFIASVLLFLSSLFICQGVYSQDESKSDASPFSEVDVSVNMYSKGFASALSWNRLHPIAFKKKFHLGYGVRLTSYFGGTADYVTAPADVTEGNFFTPQNDLKMDTLVMDKAQVNSINTTIYLMYRFSNKFGLGFNIDALGFSFGKQQTAVFSSASEQISPVSSNASVTSFNVLLTGDYDIGSLNSEMYAHYLINENIALRGGISFLFSEYTTEQKFAFNNDRFRRKSLGGMLAVSYRF